MTRGASGRPLRFFAMLLAGWMVLRLFGPGIMTAGQHPLSPTTISLPTLAPISGPVPVLAPSTRLAASAVAIVRGASLPARTMGMTPVLPSTVPSPARIPPPARKEEMTVDLMNFIAFTAGFANHHYASDPDYIGGLHSPTVSPLPLLKKTAATDRWHAGAWLLWRAGGSVGNETVTAGQLGGSQAGLRLDYDVAPHAAPRMTVYGRATSALQHPATPEGAVGLSIQPIRSLPISLATERRIALGHGGRNANVVMAVGGFGPTAIAPSLMTEAYVQTGIVGFRQRDAFIDGKFSLTTPLSATPLRLGAALSGGAQPGASRLDIGPELQIRLPLPQTSARLSVEWRQRIAGHSRPGSGLAVTLAADF